MALASLITAGSGKAALAAASATPPGMPAPHTKARAAAQDFETVFLNSMFASMSAGVDGEGPFGGGTGTGVWRSFLTEEYAKTFAKAGGIGIADHVYRSLIALQEARQP